LLTSKHRYDSLEAYLEDLENHVAPNAVLVGSPPAYHGSLRDGRNAEVLCAEKIPDVALFVEKPISASPVGDVVQILSRLAESHTTVSVGYMMRSLKVVQKAKEIIASNNLQVTATTARYFCTYPQIFKADWWNKQICCGPIVEQATHFCNKIYKGEAKLSGSHTHTRNTQATCRGTWRATSR
jgi:predicted dehydrogenase